MTVCFVIQRFMFVKVVASKVVLNIHSFQQVKTFTLFAVVVVVVV